MTYASRLGYGARRPASEHEHEHSRHPNDCATGDVQRMVHPAIRARRSDKRHHRRGEGPRKGTEHTVGEPGRQQEDEAAVDRDRRRRVTRRIAGIDGQMLGAA